MHDAHSKAPKRVQKRDFRLIIDGYHLHLESAAIFISVEMQFSWRQSFPSSSWAWAGLRRARRSEAFTALASPHAESAEMEIPRIELHESEFPVVMHSRA